DFSGLPDTSKSPSGTFKIDTSGALDLGAKRARLEMDLSQLPTDQRSGLKPGRLVMVVDDHTVYVPAAGVGIRSDKPWVKLDATAVGGSLDLTQVAQQGPEQ